MRRDHPIFPQGPTPVGSEGVAVRCPDCGPVAVAAAVTTIFGDVESGAHHLTFLCPGCGRRATQFLPVQMVAPIVLSGAALRALTRPAEADETTDAPPIGEDDVAAFAAGLNQPAWENELLN